MIDRILDIAETPARIRLELGNLVVEPPNKAATHIPLIDLAAVILSHPQITISQGALDALATAGICVITCNRARLPSGMLLSLASHSTQTERFGQQAALSLATKKRLWKQIVQAKIRAQGRTLTRLRGRTAGLIQLAGRVKTGDPENLEAQAAARYWKVLFPGGFRRRRDGADRNPHLNYGYAVLRSLAARALAGSGMHPSLGIHHHNRYNAFCLADDLMEPFRPLVDRAVAELPEGSATELCREHRAELLQVVTNRYVAIGGSRTLFDWLARTAWSLRLVAAGNRRDLEIPEIE